MNKELISIIQYNKEQRNIEFKQDENWETLKTKIIISSIAMSNLRYGGYIVIGMKLLDNGIYDPQGISQLNLNTYDIDTISENVNNYADPSVSLDIEIVEMENKKFLFILIKEFSETPIICKKDGTGMRKGAIYYRSASKVESCEIRSFEGMKELLEIAILKGVKKYINDLNYLGINLKENLEENDETKYLKERGEV